MEVQGCNEETTAGFIMSTWHEGSPGWALAPP